MLRTFGRLEVEGRVFRRPRGLLLLAYLAVEGPTARRTLARRFFPDATEPLKALGMTLTRLRAGLPGAVNEHAPLRTSTSRCATCREARSSRRCGTRPSSTSATTSGIGSRRRPAVHMAEKLHALSMPRTDGRTNSRVKDLVDVVLLRSGSGRDRRARPPGTTMRRPAVHGRRARRSGRRARRAD